MYARGWLRYVGMTSNKTLLDEITRFCERHNMSLSGVGRKFLGDPNFASDLRQPDDIYSPQMKTVNRLRAGMKDYKPKKEKRDAR